MGRIIRIDIPVRPRPVQSVRGGFRGFYVDPAVRKWKQQIRPFIEAACPDGPTDMPLIVRRVVYVFAAPKSFGKARLEYLRRGGLIPYTNRADITDNLNKGLIDVCAGIVFTDDKNIWKMCEAQKVYGIEDSIHIEFEETPEVFTSEAPASALPPVDDGDTWQWWRHQSPKRE